MRFEPVSLVCSLVGLDYWSNITFWTMSGSAFHKLLQVHMWHRELKNL